MKFSRKRLIPVLVFLAAAAGVWLTPMQVGSVTEITAYTQNSTGADSCTLFYSRGIDGNKFQSVQPLPAAAGEKTVIRFQVSPKLPMQNLRFVCAIRNREFRIERIEFGYLGIMALHQWTLPSPVFSVKSIDSGASPRLEVESIEPVALSYKAFPQNYPLKCLLILLLAAALIFWERRDVLPRWPEYSCAESPWLARLLPAVFLVYLGICIVISARSREDAHPDEAQHLSATRYYMTHWLPPRIDDPQNAYLYDHYGMTRLNSLGIEYFLAGKLAVIIKGLGGSELFACRAFNQFLLLVLFALCLAFAVTRSPLALLIPIFFLTPQTWYTFSYMNDDGLPFFLTVLFLVLYFHKPGDYRISRGIILGLLVISKANFLVFVLFAGVVALREIMPVPVDGTKIRLDRQNLKRWAMVFAIACTVVAGRAILDVKINGTNRGEKVIAANEKYAAYPFKLSTAERNPGASIWLKAMRKKGVPAADLVFRYNWLPLTAASFIAVYGYYTIPASGIFYALMAVLILALAVYILGATILRSRPAILMDLGVAAAFLVLIAALAFYRSWDFEFQPQGRHLFPFLGIAAWVVYSARDLLDRRVLNVFFSLLAGVGIYSLTITGLPALVQGI